MPGLLYFFFFNDTATTEIYTLSLHDALPILRGEKTLEDALDLAGGILPAAALRHIEVQRLVAHEKRTMLSVEIGETSNPEAVRAPLRGLRGQEIGRASCRERV